MRGLAGGPALDDAGARLAAERAFIIALGDIAPRTTGIVARRMLATGLADPVLLHD